MSVSFTISNANVLPLWDVSASLGVGQINGRDRALDPGFVPNFATRLTNPEWQHHNLGMDDSFTVSPESMFRNAGPADIAIVISYKPWFLPWRREKVFRFVTARRSDGSTYWRAWALGEVAPRF
jgi:hypothetical protein